MRNKEEKSYKIYFLHRRKDGHVVWHKSSTFFNAPIEETVSYVWNKVRNMFQEKVADTVDAPYLVRLTPTDYIDVLIMNKESFEIEEVIRYDAKELQEFD